MIRVGVAGWDYADWRGIVYPSPERRLDRLAYLSGFVDVIEINSTFYRPVAPSVAASWVRRVERRPDFRFTAKAHRSWTHERAAEPCPSVAPTLEGLLPLLEAGRLGGLLLQLPHSARFGPAVRERLDRLLDRLGGWPVAIEVRHNSWSGEEAHAWFRERATGWCWVDQPAAASSSLAALVRVTSPLAYMRLHGRNVADWFRPDAGRDARYDYLYSEDELRRVIPAARALEAGAESLYVIQNNHFRGQALVNALQMKRLLAGGRPPAPASLVAAYPFLDPIVTAERLGLF